MNIIFDSVIQNLATPTRDEFNNLIKEHIINKKTCNKFAKYIKKQKFKSKVMEICFCKQINNILLIEEITKLRKFFKKSDYCIINNFLDNKLKYIKYKKLLDELYNKFIPVFKNYLNKNNFRKPDETNYKFFFIILKEKIIPILRAYIDNTYGNISHGFLRKVNTAKTYNEKFIISNEINSRFILLVKTFSMRIIFLVSTNIDSVEDFLSLPFSIKSKLYNNIVIKLINILNNYIDVYNKYEVKENILENILETEISQLSSESEYTDEKLINSYALIEKPVS